VIILPSKFRPVGLQEVLEKQIKNNGSEMLKKGE